MKHSVGAPVDFDPVDLTGHIGGPLRAEFETHQQEVGLEDLFEVVVRRSAKVLVPRWSWSQTNRSTRNWMHGCSTGDRRMIHITKSIDFAPVSPHSRILKRPQRADHMTSMATPEAGRSTQSSSTPIRRETALQRASGNHTR
jgi:hypothetical protein